MNRKNTTSLTLLLLLSLFPVINAEDWPTYLHDDSRSGFTSAKITLPLNLKWLYRAQHAPKASWPPPAKQDLLHKLSSHKARVVFDRANQLVPANGKIYFGSSADDTVRCLNAQSGEVLWQYTCDGPVRLAPTLHQGKILFGSDDGCLYCLNSSDGSLIWKTALADKKMLPGNERIISMWPVRTNVVIQDNTACVCNGLFPNQGVWWNQVDLESGKILERKALKFSPQGYIKTDGSKWLVQAGRSKADAVIARIKRRGELNPAAVSVPEKYPYGFALTNDVNFFGGDGEIVGLSSKNAEQLWSAKVEGKAYSIIILENSLYVSTDKGLVYSFGVGSAKKVIEVKDPIEKTSLADRSINHSLKEILGQAALNKGYALLLLSANNSAKWAYELSRLSEFRIIIRVDNSKTASVLRKQLKTAGIYGSQAVVHVGDTKVLPYTSHLFNLIISDQKNTQDELKRILTPINGYCHLAGATAFRKPPLAGAGEWTHMFADPANSLCSKQDSAKKDFEMQWFGAPRPQRNDGPSPQTRITIIQKRLSFYTCHQSRLFP